VPGKAAAFDRDVFVRESWASLVDGLNGGEERAYRFAERVALVWVRPDAFAAGVTRHALAAADAAAFRPLAARPVRLDRCGARSLWAHATRHATAEGLWLLEAIAALGSGLLVLYADEKWQRGGPSAATRMTAVKDANDPVLGAKSTLREAADSPNPALTMIHAANDAADLVRELGVLVSWAERRHLIVEAARRLETGALCPVNRDMWAVNTEFASLTTPASQSADTVTEPPVSVDQLLAGPLDSRWARLQAASAQWRLTSTRPTPAWWDEAVTAP
jgi:hypothetical protein